MLLFGKGGQKLQRIEMIINSENRILIHIIFQKKVKHFFTMIDYVALLSRKTIYYLVVVVR